MVELEIFGLTAQVHRAKRLQKPRTVKPRSKARGERTLCHFPGHMNMFHDGPTYMQCRMKEPHISDPMQIMSRPEHQLDHTHLYMTNGLFEDKTSPAMFLTCDDGKTWMFVGESMQVKATSLGFPQILGNPMHSISFGTVVPYKIGPVAKGLLNPNPKKAKRDLTCTYDAFYCTKCVAFYNTKKAAMKLLNHHEDCEPDRHIQHLLGCYVCNRHYKSIQEFEDDHASNKCNVKMVAEGKEWPSWEAKKHPGGVPRTNWFAVASEDHKMAAIGGCMRDVRILVNQLKEANSSLANEKAKNKAMKRKLQLLGGAPGEEEEEEAQQQKNGQGSSGRSSSSSSSSSSSPASKKTKK